MVMGTGTGRPGGLRSLGHEGTWPPFFPTVWERGSRKKGLATARLAVSSGLGRRWRGGRRPGSRLCGPIAPFGPFELLSRV